ncbi:MAG: ribosome small subunit-dependent GTPase A [Actinomycetia bacterium]|nr:ribosome small subunit-dependent GTPase A [Actinomycetes bacterium]
MTVSRRNLHELGWVESRRHEVGDGDRVARIATEHRGYYDLFGLFEEPFVVSDNAVVSPALRRDADDLLEFPSVGDWVVVNPAAGPEGADVIESVLERRSIFVRRAPGRDPRPQAVGANIDRVLIVAGLDGDLSERRLERYLAVVYGGGCDPIIVLSKADRVANRDALDDALAAVRRVAPDVPVIVSSATSGIGIDEVAALADENRTVAFVGSSGVGKSSLVNVLLGTELQLVRETRQDGRGRHTTVRRDLIPLDSGGLLLDTPGMREVQLWDNKGLDLAFPEVAEAAESCRFRDCAHNGEPDCAVAEAVAKGLIAHARLASYRQLEGEVDGLNDELEERRRAKGEGRRNP